MAKSYLDNLLGKNEKILIVAHQHWFFLLSTVVRDIVFALVIFLLVQGASILASNQPALSSLGPLVGFGYLLLVIPLAHFIFEYMRWQNREFVVTTFRVIQVGGIANKAVTDSSLEKVNDLKMAQSFFGRTFDYGDVEILTASEIGVNLLRHIERPIHFKTILLNAKEELEHGAPVMAAPAGPAPNDIPAMITNLDQLRQKGIITEAEFMEKKADLLKKM